MINIGERLREARLKKGLTLEETQQATKIQKRYLEAIENNDYEAMPGTYYVRSFIRQYAKVVGEDGDYLVSVYDGKNIRPKFAKVEEVNTSRRALHEEEKGQRSFVKKVPYILLAIVAIAIIGVVMAMTWQSNKENTVIQKNQKVEVEGSTSSSTTETSSSSSTSSSTSSSSKAKETAKMKLTKTTDSGTTLNYTVSDAALPQKLTFAATNGACWIGISLNGGTSYTVNKTLQAGESLDTEIPAGTTKVVVNIGAASNLSAKLGSETITLQSDSGSKYQRNLTLDFAATTSTTSSSSTVE